MYMTSVLHNLTTHRYFAILSLFLKRNKIPLALFCIGFGIRFLYAVAVQLFYGSQAFFAFSDSEMYIRIATNLIHHGVLSSAVQEPFFPDSYRTPLFPLFIAFFIWLKTPLLGIVFIQNVLSGVMAAVTYKIGKILFLSETVGIVAAFLLIFEPSFIYWNSLLMSETLFSFFLLMAFHCFIIKRFHWFSVLIALATLTRPIGLYLFFIFAIAWLIWRLSAPRFLVEFRWKTAVVSVSLFILILSPWMIRNKIVFDTFELASASWFNLYMVSMGTFAQQYSLDIPKPEGGGGMFGNEFPNFSFYKHNFLTVLKENPVSFPGFYLMSTLKSFMNHDYWYLVHYVMGVKLPRIITPPIQQILYFSGAAFWFEVYVFIGIAILKREILYPALFLIALIGTNNLLNGYNGLISAGGRYALPIFPFLFLLGSYGFIVMRDFIFRYARH